ncbi:MAG: cyclic nucleotide-binding domain-containing protein [Hydrogenophaga sp.]|uniref:Crp/Fnr family transcriptional regulator n=1 Tax=Hydrogenophaga aromaticivorans TaxID=2610898 RepID=UPI0004B9FA3A|nr:cyclic nucleotide-binding domain-containing protein [Hydrogenophaga aromaticivorans]MBQ0918046.1 cyclic nucleotide-binding domain-containing protein [Hydrogenophaga aromaticivorans]MDO9294301.1 cyclic nucleotide-binding domain-containing protein [Hydrogenophaga sp.]
MNASLPAPMRADIMGLAQAMRQSGALDAVPLNLTEAQWQSLADFVQPVTLQQGQVLIEQGVKDRTVYFVETGSLTVHYEDAKERVRIALVGPGSLLGEGAFFSHLPRSATVQAGAPSRLWCLTPLRFRELSSRFPPIALELSVAMAAVLARRMYNRPKRVAVT